MKALRTILISIILVLAVVGCKKVEDVSSSTEMSEKPSANEGVLPDNCVIASLEVGGLTKEEATAKLEQGQTELMKGSLLFSVKGTEESIPWSDLNPSFNIEKAVDTALSQKDGSSEDGMNVPMEYTYDNEALSRFMVILENKYNKEPANGQIKKENGQFIIGEGTPGNVIDQQKIVEDVNNLFNADAIKPIEVVFVSLEPEFSKSDFNGKMELIGSATTAISKGSENRLTNLKVASGYLSGSNVYPGEVFSTNKTFRPSTYENGYRSAGVIVGGVLTNDIGGGVCQVSSTLYVALLKAELEIVERRNHSLKVAYLDYAFDSTLAGDYIDLKFKNNTDFPVYIEAYIDGSTLHVNVYGKEIHDPSRQVELFNEFVGSNPAPAEVIELSNDMYDDEKVQIVAPLTGKTYNLYKKVSENGKQPETVFINNSVYPARAAKYKVGTKPASTRPGAATPAPTVAPVATAVAPPSAPPVQTEAVVTAKPVAPTSEPVAPPVATPEPPEPPVTVVSEVPVEVPSEAPVVESTPEVVQ